jgi:hypothetical protein
MTKPDPAVARTVVKALLDGAYIVKPHKGNGYDEDTQPSLPQGMSGRALLEADMPSPTNIIDPWQVEGVSLLAGRPKLGKTTLLRQKAAAIAVGGTYFGASCKKGEVLFLSLEENARLMRKKLQMGRYSATDVENIDFHFDWPRGHEGAEALGRYLDAHPATNYVVVDSLTRFRDLPDKNKPPFIADYEAMQHLHAVLVNRPGRAIEVLHHTRKGKSDDPIEDISGTYGLTAACDAYVVMRYHADGAVLHVGGRLWDRDESQFMLSRVSQRWELKGVFEDMTPEQRQVIQELREAKAMSPSELAVRRGVTRQAAQSMLQRLAEAGHVICAQGVYLPKGMN